MRFMVFVPASKESEAGQLPTPALLKRMMKSNEEMVTAGVLLAGEGLHPTSKGAHSKELVAGYWVIQVKSKEEAIAWMSRAPFGGGVSIELRQIFEPADFAPIDPAGELRAKELALRSEAAQHKG